MNMLKLRPARTEREEPIERHEPIPYAPRPKPAPPDPHQLGNITLQALDQITEKSAAEFERAADQLEEAARERAEGLRECARRMRTIGFMAQEKVGNFVKVMVTCADVSLGTQGAIARCDEAPPESALESQPETETPPADEGPAAKAGLDTIEKAVADTQATTEAR